MEHKGDLWVWIETGAGRQESLALLGGGKSLARAWGGRLTAVVIGPRAERTITLAGASGADRVLAVTDGARDEEDARYYAFALQALAQRHRPMVILLAATQMGRDVAPRLAAGLEVGLSTECVALNWDRSAGRVIFTRPVLGGRELVSQLWDGPGPQLATVRPGVFHRSEPVLQSPPPLEWESIPFAPDPVRVRGLVRGMERDGVDLEGADIIVAGGRGVGGPEGFELIRSVAGTLGGVVGASRAAVDLGWISYAHQVGQTGKTVAPRLYLACGISGAVQHMAGMSGSDVIVAINRDSDAPIFRAADYAVVGDLFQVLPPLAAELDVRRG